MGQQTCGSVMAAAQAGTKGHPWRKGIVSGSVTALEAPAHNRQMAESMQSEFLKNVQETTFE